jgi:general secretion pathway protein K
MRLPSKGSPGHAATAAFLPTTERGSALLTVLWLSVAMFAIAFTVAHMVRAEVERVGTDADSFRAQYLAQGGIERARLWIEWSAAGATRIDGGPFYEEPAERLHFEFPSGEANVELIPETSKLDINQAPPADLAQLMLAAGASPDQAMAIAQAIVDWRQGDPRSTTPFDQFYLSLQPSFRSPHASFQEIEELSQVRGMTPELFYGGFRRDPDGHLYPFGGVRDCLSVYGSTGNFDVNTINPTLLRAIGAPPDAVNVIVNMRNAAPIRSIDQIGRLLGGGPAAARLSTDTSNFGNIWTLRSTGRLRFADGTYSEVKRTVAAQVRFFRAGHNPLDTILRWYDEAPPAPAARPFAVNPGGINQAVSFQ